MRAPNGQMARLSREQSKLRTRRQLLDAAREVFGRTGYQGARLDDIAAAAGFTKGAVYWHFPNKRTLFLELVKDSIDANLALLDGFLNLGETDPEVLKRTLGEWVDVIDRQETLPALGAELEVLSRHDPSFRVIHQHVVGRHEQALAKFLTRYFELVGEQPPIPVEELAPALISIFKGFALCRQNRPDWPITSANTVRLLLGLEVSAREG